MEIMIDREEIEDRIDDLSFRAGFVNQWIMKNLETDPNAYEMTSYLMDFQDIASVCCGAIYDAGVRAKEAGEREHRFAGEETFPLAVKEFKGFGQLSNEVEKMLELRGIKCSGLHVDQEIHSDFFDVNPDVSAFYSEILYHMGPNEENKGNTLV